MIVLPILSYLLVKDQQESTALRVRRGALKLAVDKIFPHLQKDFEGG